MTHPLGPRSYEQLTPKGALSPPGYTPDSWQGQTPEKLIEEAIEHGLFPGCGAVAVQDGEIVKEIYRGQTRRGETARPIKPHVFFDLASLTKPLATSLVAMDLVGHGPLDLDQPVSAFFTQLDGDDWSDVPVWRLLNHSSGLTDWKPFFETDTEEGDIRSRVIRQILHDPECRVARPGERHLYSDLGFILLDEIFQRIEGAQVDELLRDLMERMPEPNTLHFNPLGRQRHFPMTRYAATEYSAWRSMRLQGRVHDDNGYALGGVCGHAGLFGSLRDVASVTTKLMDCHQGRSDWLPQAVVRDFWRVREEPDGALYSLGWMGPEPLYSSAGCHFPRTGVGHLGFTGSMLWIAPERRLAVALLTNRVYNGRSDERIRWFRPVFMDCLWAHLGWGRS